MGDIMTNNNTQLQSFLAEVLDRAASVCSDEFLKYFRFIQQERERLLDSVWHEIPAGEQTPDMKQFVFKEIDFDSIVTHSKSYITNAEDYFRLVFDIAVIAINYGYFIKAALLLNRIVKNNQKGIDERLKANSYKKLGEIHFYKNNFTLAEESIEQSLNYFSVLKDTLEIARNKNSLGIIRVEKNLPVEGKLLFLEAQKLSGDFNDAQLTMKILINLGIVSHRLGELGEAMEYFQDALKLVNGDANKAQRAQVLHNIGVVYKSKEEYGKASAYFMKSISLCKETYNVYQKGLSYLEYAHVTAHMRDLPKAMALATTAFPIFSELGAKMHIAEVYKLYGMINRMGGKYDIALSYLENSKRINHEYNNHFNLGETYFEMGEYYRATGDKKQSLENYQESIKQFQFIQANKKAADVEYVMNRLPLSN